MRLYYFTNRKYGLQDIRMRRLKIARIAQLNDPFEFLGVASRSPITRRKYADLKAGWDKFMGVLCFSAGWQNPVQWSHYADHHRGLCLGFDISAKVHRVSYVVQRLKQNERALRREGPEAEKHVFEILTTKFKHWEYEDERRVFPQLQVSDARGLYFFEFGSEMVLKRVIVGHRSDVSQAELSRALGNLASSVERFKARLAFRTFRVVKQKDPTMWD